MSTQHLPPPPVPTATRARPLVLALALLLSTTATATDTRSTPFDGGSLMHRVTGSQDLWVLEVDLCAAGIDVKTTSNALKGRTVGSFSAAVGALAAVNGDFFSPSFSTDGPAMSDGQAWGAGTDHGYVAPISFASHAVDVPHHNNTVGPLPGAREVVSGHPTLLDDGGVVGNPGDPLCTNRHPRTALGISQDHRRLILAVVDGRRAGAAGMTCPELAALMAEHGAFDAVNMDGGGSSTMVVGGALQNRPSDGQQRTVGNHLAIVRRADGDSALCPERAPIGVLDAADCEGGIAGWAADGDDLAAPVDVHVYIGGPAGSGAPGFAVTANQQRDDLCPLLGCDHGFTMPVPFGLRDGQARDVFAYAIDLPGGTRGNPQLQNAPRSLTCAPPTMPSLSAPRRRHVVDPASFAAWHLALIDVATFDAAVVDAIDHGPPMPSLPRLVQGESDPVVYVVDDIDGLAVRRHVVDMTSFIAWGFSLGDIELAPAVALSSMVEGPPWPARPFAFVQAGAPAVYLLDEAVVDEGLGSPDDNGEPLTPDGPGSDEAADRPARRTIEVAAAGCQQSGPQASLLTGLLLVGLTVRRRRR